MSGVRGRILRWLAAAWVAGSACTGAETTKPVPREQSVDWRQLAPAPSKRTEVGAAAADARIFIMGGFSDSEATVGTVEIYDTQTEGWQIGPPLPVSVNHPMATGHGGDVYVFGGYLGPGLADATDRAFVLRGNRWLELPPMPEPRAAGGAATIEDRIYIAGGVGPEGLASTTMVFEPAAARWSTSPGVPTQREHLGVASDGERLYVIGGRTSAGNLATAEAFDPAANRWTSLPDMPTPRGGLAGAATSNGFVVAAGGEAEATFDEAEAFDVEDGSWRSLPLMPTARHGLGVVAVENVVYVIAGGPTPGFAFSDANEAIDLTPLRP
jgi:non-specific serine/threonine protein kinase